MSHHQEGRRLRGSHLPSPGERLGPALVSIRPRNARWLGDPGRPLPARQSPGGGVGERTQCLSEVWEVVPLSQRNHKSILPSDSLLGSGCVTSGKCLFPEGSGQSQRTHEVKSGSLPK